MVDMASSSVNSIVDDVNVENSKDVNFDNESDNDVEEDGFFSLMSCLMVKNLIFGSAFVNCVSLLSNLFNHNACVAAAVAAMNSDPHDDNATVVCFCVLQLVGDSP
nr:hypothetical protein [Tanacetum cinerariifolium]